jgi:hypothetical protein
MSTSLTPPQRHAVQPAKITPLKAPGAKPASASDRKPGDTAKSQERSQNSISPGKSKIFGAPLAEVHDVTSSAAYTFKRGSALERMAEEARTGASPSSMSSNASINRSTTTPAGLTANSTHEQVRLKAQGILNGHLEGKPVAMEEVLDLVQRVLDQTKLSPNDIFGATGKNADGERTRAEVLKNKINEHQEQIEEIRARLRTNPGSVHPNSVRNALWMAMNFLDEHVRICTDELVEIKTAGTLGFLQEGGSQAIGSGVANGLMIPATHYLLNTARSAFVPAWTAVYLAVDLTLYALSLATTRVSQVGTDTSRQNDRPQTQLLHKVTYYCGLSAHVALPVGLAAYGALTGQSNTYLKAAAKVSVGNTATASGRTIRELAQTALNTAQTRGATPKFANGADLRPLDLQNIKIIREVFYAASSALILTSSSVFVASHIKSALEWMWQSFDLRDSTSPDVASPFAGFLSEGFDHLWPEVAKYVYAAIHNKGRALSDPERIVFHRASETTKNPFAKVHEALNPPEAGHAQKMAGLRMAQWQNARNVAASEAWSFAYRAAGRTNLLGIQDWFNAVATAAGALDHGTIAIVLRCFANVANLVIGGQRAPIVAWLQNPAGADAPSGTFAWFMETVNGTADGIEPERLLRVEGVAQGLRRAYSRLTEFRNKLPLQYRNLGKTEWDQAIADAGQRAKDKKPAAGDKELLEVNAYLAAIKKERDRLKAMQGSPQDKVGEQGHAVLDFTEGTVTTGLEHYIEHQLAMVAIAEYRLKHDKTMGSPIVVDGSWQLCAELNIARDEDEPGDFAWIREAHADGEITVESATHLTMQMVELFSAEVHGRFGYDIPLENSSHADATLLDASFIRAADLGYGARTSIPRLNVARAEHYAEIVAAVSTACNCSMAIAAAVVAHLTVRQEREQKARDGAVAHAAVMEASSLASTVTSNSRLIPSNSAAAVTSVTMTTLNTSTITAPATPVDLSPEWSLIDQLSDSSDTQSSGEDAHIAKGAKIGESRTASTGAANTQRATNQQVLDDPDFDPSTSPDTTAAIEDCISSLKSLHDERELRDAIRESRTAATKLLGNIRSGDRATWIQVLHSGLAREMGDLSRAHGLMPLAEAVYAHMHEH